MTRNTGTLYMKGHFKNRKQRVRMKAAEYARRLMAKDYIVTEPPALQRVVRMIYVENNTVKRSAWYACATISRVWGSMRAERKHRDIQGVERAWQITANTHSNVWVHLEYAQAERDALNLHYARYLMVKGTKGAEYL